MYYYAISILPIQAKTPKNLKKIAVTIGILTVI